VLVQKVDVFVTVVVVVADRQTRAVIIEIDAEPLSLFPRQKIHPKRDSCLLRALLKTRSSGGWSSPVSTRRKYPAIDTATTTVRASAAARGLFLLDIFGILRGRKKSRPIES
jgi:hypothetical protein